MGPQLTNFPVQYIWLGLGYTEGLGDSLITYSRVEGWIFPPVPLFYLLQTSPFPSSPLFLFFSKFCQRSLEATQGLKSRMSAHVGSLGKRQAAVCKFVVGVGHRSLTRDHWASRNAKERPLRALSGPQGPHKALEDLMRP